DADPYVVSWFLQDNGYILEPLTQGQCSSTDSMCNRYATAQGVRDAWIYLFDRLKARWPNKKIVLSTGPVTYKSTTEQMAAFQQVLSHTAGYFSESFTNDHAYWNTQPNSGKRTA